MFNDYRDATFHSEGGFHLHWDADGNPVGPTSPGALHVNPKPPATGGGGANPVTSSTELTPAQIARAEERNILDADTVQGLLDGTIQLPAEEVRDIQYQISKAEESASSNPLDPTIRGFDLTPTTSDKETSRLNLDPATGRLDVIGPDGTVTRLTDGIITGGEGSVYDKTGTRFFLIDTPGQIVVYDQFADRYMYFNDAATAKGVSLSTIGAATAGAEAPKTLEEQQAENRAEREAIEAKKAEVAAQFVKDNPDFVTDGEMVVNYETGKSYVVGYTKEYGYDMRPTGQSASLVRAWGIKQELADNPIGEGTSFDGARGTAEFSGLKNYLVNAGLIDEYWKAATGRQPTPAELSAALGAVDPNTGKFQSGSFGDLQLDTSIRQELEAIQKYGMATSEESLESLRNLQNIFREVADTSGNEFVDPFGGGLGPFKPTPDLDGDIKVMSPQLAELYRTEGAASVNGSVPGFTFDETGQLTGVPGFDTSEDLTGDALAERALEVKQESAKDLSALPAILAQYVDQAQGKGYGVQPSTRGWTITLPDGTTTGSYLTQQDALDALARMEYRNWQITMEKKQQPSQPIRPSVASLRPTFGEPTQNPNPSGYTSRPPGQTLPDLPLPVDPAPPTPPNPPQAQLPDNRYLPVFAFDEGGSVQTRDTGAGPRPPAEDWGKHPAEDWLDFLRRIAPMLTGESRLNSERYFSPRRPSPSVNLFNPNIKLDPSQVQDRRLEGMLDQLQMEGFADGGAVNTTQNLGQPGGQPHLMLDEPAVLTGLESGKPYAVAGEVGKKEMVSQAPDGGLNFTPTQMPQSGTPTAAPQAPDPVAEALARHDYQRVAALTKTPLSRVLRDAATKIRPKM